MTELRQILEDFQEYMLTKDERIVQHVLPNTHLDAKQRVQIYEGSYYFRLIEILEKDYPTICQLLGWDAFEKIARDYIDTFPSNHFSISFFGRHFSKFLARQPDIDPMLVEMAIFEHALDYVLFNEEGPRLSMQDLTQVPPEAWGYLQLSLHPSVRFVEAHYKIPEIWHAVQEKKKVPVSVRQEEKTTFMIWRWDQRSFYVALDEPQTWMLAQIQEGKIFGDICEGLCQWYREDQVAGFAGQHLSNWLSEGVISSFQVLSEDD